MPNDSQLITLELNCISRHHAYNRFISIIATSDYLLPVGSTLTEEALETILNIHPIVVVSDRSTKKNRYYCVGGIRSYLLAKTLDPTAVPALLLSGRNHKSVEMLVHTDIMLSPLLYSLRHLSDVGRIYETIGPKGVASIFNERNRTKAALAKNMQVAKNTLFLSQSYPKTTSIHKNQS